VGCFCDDEISDSNVTFVYPWRMRLYAAPGSFCPQVEKTLAHYGENKFDIPLPTFGDMYKEQITSPFFVFQMFCILVRGWLHLLDECESYFSFKCTTGASGLIVVIETGGGLGGRT
jgi:hypothetical protein